MIFRVEGLHVNTAYLLTTLLCAAMVAFSGLGKIRRDPRIVHLIHKDIGVPLKYFWLLAACELPPWCHLACHKRDDASPSAAKASTA